MDDEAVVFVFGLTNILRRGAVGLLTLVIMAGITGHSLAFFTFDAHLPARALELLLLLPSCILLTLRDISACDLAFKIGLVFVVILIDSFEGV